MERRYEYIILRYCFVQWQTTQCKIILFSGTSFSQANTKMCDYTIFWYYFFKRKQHALRPMLLSVISTVAMLT